MRVRRNDNLMAAEETRIERICTRPQRSDCGSHDDHFKGRQPAVEQVPADGRQPRKRIREADNRNRDAHNRSEKSNQEAGATHSQCQGGEKRFKRRIATLRQVNNALGRGYGPNH